MDIKILVVSHKEYWMPKDSIYYPIQVGSNKTNFKGFLRDNTADNISERNPRLCELTAVYWAWKNLKADYIGITHYRRHFTCLSGIRRIGKKKDECILNSQQLEEELKNCDIIVPNRRKYFIETLESHLIHTPYVLERDYKVLRKVIEEFSPEYLNAYDTVMNRKWGHMFNMFIMKSSVFDEYCKWLFPILLECDKRIYVTGYSYMEARQVAYYAEFMLDIWMEKNGLSYKEMKVIFMEKQKWIKKGILFVYRKLLYMKRGL